MTDIEFGLFDSFGRDEIGTGEQTADMYDAHIADAQTAETLGHRYYFFIEHQNAGFPCVSSPNVYLAAIARATTTLRFGPMVYQLPMHHPVRLAQDAAMVDQLSRGRLEFSIGYGTRAAEFDRWKLNFAERRDMGIEAMDIVLQAWTQSQLSYEGRYWAFDGALPQPRPFQKPYPPIWMGCHSPASFDYAAEHNYHVAQNLDVERVIAQKFAYFRQVWHERGHSGPLPHQMLVRHVHVAETDEQARAEAEPFMREGVGGTFGVTRARSLRPEEQTPEMLEIARVYVESADAYEFWIDEGMALVGSPETVIRRLREQQQLTGFDVFCAQHHIASMPVALARKSLRLFGERVIPAFR
jgi:alkanesulfonate monooxygenase SsuD/methylene tetrahydromethanopterin reductase-like flavin-dependent oxidoreductase (luciferase family)